MDFLNTLEQMKFSIWVRESGSVWAYPLILCLHTMGMATVAGISGAISLRLLGISPHTPIKPMEKMYPLLWWGFGLNAITGTMLLVADASTKLMNWDFYVKMVIIFIGLGVMNRIRKLVFADPQLDSAPVSSTAKGLAWGSLLCWFGAITAGRLLAYVGPVAGLAGSK